MKRLLIIPTVLALTCCACGHEVPENTKPDDPTPVEPVVETKGAKAYVTTADKSQLFAESTIEFGKAASMSPNIVRFTEDRYQSVDGFGLAITQASCYNLLKMSKADRTRFLTELFDPIDGVGSSLIRVCIGGSDFSMSEYTWCDSEGISHFAIHESEFTYLFPILDEIYAINPNVKIIGSPWSVPIWMKMAVSGNGAHNAWTSGRLNPKYYKDYATYFVKWIQAMEARGYKVMAVTLQNEPLNHGNSMSTYMPWTDQRDFLVQGIGPAFKAAGLSTKVLLFDHNYNYDNQGDQNNYPINILNDKEANAFAAGSAWHNYGGSVTVLDGVHSAFPDKDIYFTEASIGTWNYNFASCLINDFRDIFLGTLGRYGKGVTLWNLMLDNERKPYRPGGCSTCYGAVTINNSTYAYSSIERNTHYYNVAHASKVVKPGAVRIGTKGVSKTGVTYQAYLNTDGSYGILILNESSSEQQLVFATDKRSVTVNIPAKSIESVIWNEKE
ncbi:MAG: glucosylceramidase [Bacteroidales bacterium]|nr:glucosylceramidase [Bacteroidales bacterium]MBQ1842317.1 glucosylceramidase [Bacteroidales bacterium]MBQ2550737.1 glucosylceramidase [Bacteroidales bacterium]